MNVTAENEEGQQQDGEQEQQQQEESQPQDGATTEGGEATETDAELVYSFGEESPPQEEEVPEGAPDWVRNLRKDQQELRKKTRDLEREKAELQKQIEAAKAPKEDAALVMPKIDDEGIDYDSDVFADRMKAYLTQVSAKEAKQREKEQEAKTEQEAWTAKVTAYNAGKVGLKAKDADEMETEVTAACNQTQIGILINGADNPSKLVYALGKNPAKLKELASIKDPVKFAFAAAKLETEMKATPRKAAVAAESSVRGSGPASAVSGDTKLEQLRARAIETGNMTELTAYKRQQRAAGKG